MKLEDQEAIDLVPSDLLASKSCCIIIFSLYFLNVLIA
jgi:hypothetical protein